MFTTNNNPNSPTTITTVTSPSPSLSSPSSSSSSPSPLSSTSSPPSNYCDQDASFIINNNHCEMIGNGNNDNGVNYINNLNNTGIADFNNINVNDNLVASHKLNQQTIIQNNFFSACHQSSYQNQLSLDINNADNISNSIVEDSKIIVPAQHHQQPIESINNDNDISIISQNHQFQIQQLQLHQQQPNKFLHHDRIPQVHQNHQLITRNSTPNFHSTIDTNKMFEQFQVDKENQRSIPNIQPFTKALDNNITQNIGNNVDSNNAGNPIFVIDHSNNCFTTLSTPNTPTFPPPGQINNGISHNGNNNSSNYPPPSSTLLKPPNQVPRKGHTRKRSLSAPTIPSEIQDSLVVPSSSSYYQQQQQQQHHQYYNYHNHLYQQQHHHYPINYSPFIGKPNVLVPIQRNPKNLSQSSQPPMSSEEYRHKLNEELEKVDFSDITVSELKDLLRQRNKPATGKKAILMQRLQEEVKLVKAIKNKKKNNKSGTGNSNDNNSSDSKDVNNNNTGDNNTSDNNVDDNHIVNNVNVTNNNTNNTDDNDNNEFDQQQQQQQQQQQTHQPMTTSSTITDNKMLDHYDVMTINHNSNNNTTTNSSSLLQQLNIDDSSNTISHQGFFFQHHPMSAPAIKTEFFTSLEDNNNNNDTTTDNDDGIVIKDEEMSNVNNSGDVTAVNGYDTYHQQPSSAPSMMTEFNNSYDFINHQLSNKTSLSSMDDGNDDSQMMMSNDPNDPTSPVSTASLLLNDPLRMFVSSPLQHHYNEEAYQFIFNQNQQQQTLQDDGNMMNIKTEEDNLGYFTTPYTLTQQVEDIVMVGGMV